MEAKNNLQKLKVLTNSLLDRDYLLKRKVMVYESIIKTLIKGIWIIDNNENTIYADEMVTEMLKCSLEDMQDKSVYEFISDMDKKIARKYINNSKKGIVKEFNFKTKDGENVKSTITNLVSAEDVQEKGIKFLFIDNKTN